jgi:hypothetical protein
MDKTRTRWLTASAGAIALWNSPALAQTETQGPTVPESEMAQDIFDATAVRRNATYLDLTGSLGYSTNPMLRTVDSQSSIFGRASARGVHMWNGERSSTSLSAFVEGTTYFNDYGVKSIFSLSGDTQRQVSERVRLFGSAGVSGDLAGQLSNRFLYVPPLPEVPVEGEPPPVTVDDPDIFSFSGRQYRVYAQGGAAIRVSPRGSLSLSGGAQRIFYTDEFFDDYTTVFGNGSYNHSLSDRTTVGFNVGVRRTDYDNSSDNSTIINPGISVHTRLSEYWDVSGGVGVSFSDVERNGDNSNSTSLSFNGSVCNTTENDRFCGRVSRYSNSTSRSALVTTTSLGVDWFRKLDAAQTIQLSASVVRYVADDELDDNFKTNHFRLAGSYSRTISGRLSAGADVGVRALRRDGVDPDTDFSGSLFVRYRVGDLG